MLNYSILQTEPDNGYELLDSGEGEKLERYGQIVAARPDPQALWPKRLEEKEWTKAQAYFKRASENAEWSKRGQVPERWPIEFNGLKFWIKLSAFKHTGIFPEQSENWKWIQQQVQRCCHSDRASGRVEESLSQRSSDSSTSLHSARNDSAPKVLNLFGYTGGASLAAAKAGAEVVHVDGSKVAIGWARDNAELSGLGDKPIRWILDDAFAFVKREIRRGNKYDGIIMDPPAFGHGPKKELWKIEESFLPFLDACREILSDKPLFFLINGYAAGYSALAYKNNLGWLLEKYGGTVEVGELTIQEKGSERLLPAGIFARWSAS